MTEEVGYGKPPKASQFGQPGGNPSGKTKVQKRQEMVNAEKAVKIRGKLLEAMEEALEDLGAEKLMEHLNPNTLKMLKDAEDRGLGAPVQPTVDVGDEGTPKGMKDFYAISNDD